MHGLYHLPTQAKVLHTELLLVLPPGGLRGSGEVILTLTGFSSDTGLHTDLHITAAAALRVGLSRGHYLQEVQLQLSMEDGTQIQILRVREEKV